MSTGPICIDGHTWVHANFTRPNAECLFCGFYRPRMIVETAESAPGFVLTDRAPLFRIVPHERQFPGASEYLP